MKKLIIATIIIMSVGCSATNNGVSLDASPFVSMSQKIPSVAFGSGVHIEGPIEAKVDNGVGVALPFVGVDAELGSLSVGPEKLNVTVGNDNSVTVGPLQMAQSLPSAKVGLSANKDRFFDLSLSGEGLGIVLPLFSLDIPCPKLSLEKKGGSDK